jgi:hypothetical protein
MSAHPAPVPMRPVNYVFVDFENVHEVNLSVIGSKDVHFTLLLGAQQKKLDAALVEKLMEHAGSVQLVRLTSAGKNALDFAIAYYVGRAVMADPGAHYHIISKDTGFDPLIEHLKKRHIHARRHNDFTSLTFTAPAKPVAPNADDLTRRVLEHLRKNPGNRPKRKKTLVSNLWAFSGKSVPESEIINLVEDLKKSGHISINDKDAVTYHL